tara:strand:- start:200 stop:577 length:378 start_codon:yes stop_codon:yes gene_type:complete
MKLLSKFNTGLLQKFIFGGIATTVLGLFIEYAQFGIAYSCYLYAALPTVYFYLFWVTYKAHGIKKLGTLHIHLAIGSFIFVLFCLLIYALYNYLKFSYNNSVIMACIWFVIISYVYYKTLLFKTF